MTEPNITSPVIESPVAASAATVDLGAPSTAPESNVTVDTSAPASSATASTPTPVPTTSATEGNTQPEVKPASSILTPPSSEKTPSEGEVTTQANDNNAPSAPVTQVAPELPVYESFVLPEGATVDDKEMESFKSLIGEYKAPQEFGQKLIDRHIAEMQKFQQAQLQAWETEKEAWAEDFRKDPELGGNRAQTTIDSAHKFIRTHGGTPEQQTELYEILARTGLNNHKALIRIFAKAAASPALTEGTPKPAPQNPVSLDRAARWYGKTG